MKTVEELTLAEFQQIRETVAYGIYGWTFSEMSCGGPSGTPSAEQYQAAERLMHSGLIDLESVPSHKFFRFS